MAENESDKKRDVESRRILNRIAAESEAGGSSLVARSLDRTRKHFDASDADPADPIEIWGTRIGRGLGIILLVVMVGWLVSVVASQS